jgi:hypothetical protein
VHVGARFRVEPSTGHWEMEKRRKETKEWLRRREQEVRGRLNSPSIVPRQTAGEKVSSD